MKEFQKEILALNHIKTDMNNMQLACLLLESNLLG